MDKIPNALLPEFVDDGLPAQFGTTPVVSTTGERSPDLIPLYDHKNKAVLSVPQAELPAYLKSPQYTVQKGSSFNVVSPEGTVNSIDGAEIGQALQSGYRLEAPEETHERKLQEQYGDVGSQALAGLAGVGRGLTFGLSDQALVRSGAVNPETLSGLEEANPASSVVGEVGGILGPAVFTGGSSVAAKGALSAGSAVRGAAEAGKIAERVLVRQAEKAGLSSALAKTIVEKIGPKAAGSAVEGAFFGAGQLLTEDALGRADLNAENLASYIGTGALINGAFGAGLAGAGELVKPISQIAKYAAEPFAAKATNALDSEVASGRLLGLTPTQLQKLKVRNPRVAEGLEEYLKKDLGLSITDTAESLAQKNQAIKESAGANIGKVLDDLDNVLNANPELRPTSEAVWGNVWKKTMAAAEDVMSSNVPGAEKYRKQAAEFLDDIAKMAKSSKEFQASDLQKMKQGFDKLLKYEKEPGKWTLLEDLIFTSRTAIRDEIDLLAQNMQARGLSDDLATQLKDANRQWASSATFGDFLEKRALKSADRGGSITDAMKDVGLDLSRKLVVLGKIEKARQVADRILVKTVTSLGELARPIPAATTVALPSLLKSSIAVDYSSGKPKAAKTAQQAYTNAVNNVTSFQQSPTQFIEKTNRQTSSIYGAAPQTSAQLDALAFKAMSYLGTKIPKSSRQPTLLSSYRPPKMPSSLEMGKFARIVHAVEKPMTVLHNLQAGTVTREEIDVLKNVYPAIFGDLRDKIMLRLPELQHKMPYNRRIQLGLLMDVPADPSMQASNVMGLQAQFDSQEQPDQGAVNPTVTGISNMSFGDNMTTPTQSVQGESEA